MALTYIAISTICNDCIKEGKNEDCFGIKCHLRRIEAGEEDGRNDRKGSP